MDTYKIRIENNVNTTRKTNHNDIHPLCVQHKKNYATA